MSETNDSCRSKVFLYAVIENIFWAAIFFAILYLPQIHNAWVIVPILFLNSFVNKKPHGK
jgi:hypothetical protein